MSTPSAAPLAAPSYDPATVVQDTVRWLERAVIGLNLCPFAKGVHTKGQVHYVVSAALDAESLAHDLARELEALAEISPEQRDTTLLESLDLHGILQIASFHPQFQFAGTAENDVTNCTNRTPYPTLHLLREDSIDRAVEAFPEAEEIFERNIEVLEKLGKHGWDALDLGARCPVAHAPAKEQA